MIYITGDTHGSIEDTKKITELRRKHVLTPDDYIIICGDFGFAWDMPVLTRRQKEEGETYESVYGSEWYRIESSEEKWHLDWFEKNISCPALFIDGNHENFDRLNRYPVESWHGGKVQFIRPNVIHLMRGQTYDIGGLEVFAFGGAPSHDRAYRKEHVSWWAEEMPSEREIEEGRQNLNHPDLVITHFLPESIDPFKNHTVFGSFLDEVYENGFKRWFCGHYHVDKKYKGIDLVYQNIHSLQKA